MKKKYSPLLVILLFVLTGCTVNTEHAFKAKIANQQRDSKEDIAESNVKNTKATAVIENNFQDNSIENTATEETSPIPQERTTGINDFGITSSDFDKTIMLDKTILYNDKDVIITANGLNYQDRNFEIDLTFENNSNKNLSFTAETMGYSVNGINGFMVENGYLNIPVAAGSSANDVITFNYDELILLGISKIADIQIGFEISDDDYNSFYTGPLHAKTALADEYDYDNTDYHKEINSKAVSINYGLEMEHFSEDTVYDSYGVSIISEAYMINQNGKGSLLLEVKNATDKIIYFNIREIKVNGIEIYDTIWSSDCITPGNRMVIAIALDRVLEEDEWEAKGISDIETIGMKVEASDSESNIITEPADISIPVK